MKDAPATANAGAYKTNRRTFMDVNYYASLHQKRLQQHKEQGTPYEKVLLGGEMELPLVVDKLNEAFDEAMFIAEACGYYIESDTANNEIRTQNPYDPMACAKYVQREDGKLELAEILPAPRFRSDYIPQFFVNCGYRSAVNHNGEMVLKSDAMPFDSLADAAIAAISAMANYLDYSDGWHDINHQFWTIEDQHRSDYPGPIIYWPQKQRFEFSKTIQEALEKAGKKDIGKEAHVTHATYMRPDIQPGDSGYIIDYKEDGNARYYLIHWRTGKNTKSKPRNWVGDYRAEVKNA
jgi:hypothetical protein